MPDTTKSAARFFAQVDASGDCWLWMGTLNSRGYGRFPREGRTIAAHRWAYQYLVEELPQDLELVQLCRQRLCVNPDHVQPMTKKEKARFIRAGSRVNGHRVCSIESCTNPRESKGWCIKHLRRWQTHGDPVATSTPNLIEGTPEERFKARVGEAQADGCVPWTGSVNPDGYGRFSMDGTTVNAHQVAYLFADGPIPEGMHLDHVCHTKDSSCVGGAACLHRRCVNPDHLEVVTPAENSRRGLSPFAVNARKTHCVHGHPFDELNTVLDRNGHRQCKACKANRRRDGRSDRLVGLGGGA